MDPKLYNTVAISGDLFKEITTDPFDPIMNQVTRGRENNILHLAAQSGNGQSAHCILEVNPSLASIPNKKGDTPLHIAARLGHLSVVTLLADHHVIPKDDMARNIRSLNKGNNTALHEAVRNGHFEVVKFLMGRDDELASISNDAGESPLFLAVDRECHEIALFILRSSQNCSFSGRNGMNITHAATIHSPLSFLQKILEKCGSQILYEPDSFGWTALHYAAHLGNADAVDIILEKEGLLAYEPDKEGMTACHVAARNGKTMVLKKLIEKRPDICELLDNKDRTCLHVATENGQRDVVKMLLEMMAFGDLLNEQDVEGNTSLHLAVITEHFVIIQILAMDNRVDKGITNKKGMTAFDIARLLKPTLTPFEWGPIESLLKREGIMRSFDGSVMIEKERVKKLYTFNKKVHETSQRNVTVMDKNAVESSTSEVGDRGKQEDWDVNVGMKLENFLEKSSREDDAKNVISIQLVITTIIASVTFAAAMQLPGGYDSHGKAQLRDKTPFKYFIICDTVAFGCSAASMLSFFLIGFISRYIHRLKPYFYLYVVFLPYINTASITLVFLAFISATKAVLSDSSSKSSVTPENLSRLISFLLPMIWFSILLILFIITYFSTISTVCHLYLRNQFMKIRRKALSSGLFKERTL